MVVETNTILLYVILGAIIGIVWSLRKIYTVEAKIISLENKLVKKRR
jgi:hypothetical protein